MTTQECGIEAGTGAGVGIGTETVSKAKEQSTQNTQYDEIGERYGDIKLKPVAQPERSSVIAVLGDVKGKRCLDLACGLGYYTALLASLGASSVHGYDISSSMIEGARAAYPSASHPNIHFGIADCSSLESLPAHLEPFDIVFAGWFLNYAGTESELTSMFRVIARNLAPGGRFVGITTNGHDERMKEPREDFYGLDVEVLDPDYVAPDTGVSVGIRAKVTPHSDPPFSFNVFQFRAEIYDRCAQAAGLSIRWCERTLPDDERRTTEYWDEWLARPTSSIIEAVIAH